MGLPVKGARKDSTSNWYVFTKMKAPLRRAPLLTISNLVQHTMIETYEVQPSRFRPFLASAASSGGHRLA